jgi:hypothetical protein
MGTQPAEPLDDVLLSLTVINALEVAAARRDGRPLGTLDILLGILGIDLTWGWESVQIEASFVTQDDVERFADPQPQAKGHWHNVPLTTTATRALQTAAAIADRYKLEPMPGGALALGLLADPRSAASLALLANTSISHQRLLVLIQENVLDTSLEGLDLAGGAGDGARSGARFVSSGIPGKGPGQPREAVDVGTAALARAQEIEGSESPGSLALLAAAIDLNADPDLADLLDSMLIDRDDLAGFARKRRSEDASAEEVVQSAAERYGDSLDPAGLIAAAAQRDSPRLRSALSIPRLPPRELAAQVAEWRRRRADKGATTTLHLVVSVLHLLGSIATSILLVLSVLGSGEWWWLALLYPVWSGYPKEGLWFGAAVAVVLGVLVGPVVAAAQAVTVLLEIAQATIERDLLWAGTGIRISIRQQRHVVCRLLNARGRRVQKSRQLARLMIAAWFSR